MVGEGKFSVRLIVHAHHRTLVDARTEQPAIRDYLTVYGIPMMAFALLLALGVNLGDSVGNLLSAVGLASAFLFGLVIQMYGRATDWADNPPPPGATTSRYALLQQELTINAAYAATVTGIIAVALVAYDVDIGLHRFVALDTPRRFLASAILAGLLHWILSLSLVLRRVVQLTQERLTRARTGADREDRGGTFRRHAG